MEDAARKQRILKKYEDKLRRGLAVDLEAEKIQKIVSRVRQSKISLFKGQRKIALRNQTEDQTELQQEILKHLKKLESRTQKWLELTDDEILSRYI